MTDRPEGKHFPDPIERAYSLHNDYLDDLEEWRKRRNEQAQRLAIWSSIYWAFQNAEDLGLKQEHIRSALGFPDESWGDAPFEYLGLTENVSISEYFEGELPMSAQLSQIKQNKELPPFITEGREFIDQRQDVEISAEIFRNYFFYGDVNTRPSNASKGEVTKFQESFADLSYISQVRIAKKLTAGLGESEIGRQILANLVDPYYDTDEKPRTFRVLYLLDPSTVWNDSDTEYLVNPPSKSEVTSDNNAYLATNSEGEPYPRDLKLANSLVCLAGQCMPGVTRWQVHQGGNLRGGNIQMAIMFGMIDGGLSNSSWKRFKKSGGSSDAPKVFNALGTALSQGESILEEFIEDSKNRYQVSNYESAGRQAKLRQYKLYSANFAGLLTSISAAWGAIAKANKDQLDFDWQGAYNTFGGVVDSAELYKNFRDLTGMNYDEIKFRNGEMVKYTETGVESLSDTVIKWIDGAMNAFDAVMSAVGAYSAYNDQEYDVMAFSGIGAGLAIAGIWASGIGAVVVALAALLVSSIKNWLDDDAVTAWARRTVYGDTDVPESKSTDPNSKWFGYNGYERTKAAAGSRKVSGKNRQISGFYDVVTPFSLDGPIKIRDDGGTYSCSFTCKKMTMAGVGSGFLLQPIYHTGGSYKVGKVVHDITAIQAIEDFDSYQYKGNEGSINGLDLKVEAVFEGGAASVSDQKTPMKEAQISLTNADSVSDLFGLEKSTIQGSNPAYLEVIHTPANMKSLTKKELSAALGETPSDAMVDTITDQQPYPRQRNKLEIV